MRLAFAAGQVRLATHLGVTLGKWSNFPPATPHFCFVAASASPKITFVLLKRGRLALRSLRIVHTAGPAVPGTCVLVSNGSPRTSGWAETPPRVRTALRRFPFGRQWSRRLSAFLQPGILPVPDLRPALPFGLTSRVLSK